MNETKTENENKFLCMASEQELIDFAKQNGIEGYRAKQVERWISKRWVVDPENMTDLSKKAQQAFREHFLCDYPELAGWERSDDLSYREKLNAAVSKIKAADYPVPVTFTPHAYWFDPDAAPCSCREKRIHIRHDGNVGFCTDYFGFSAGNVRAQSIREILNSPRAQLFHKAVEENKLPICRHCPWRLQSI